MPKRDDLIINALSNLEHKINALDSRLDSVDSKIAEGNITSVKQEANLNEHMRRTDLAEKSIAGIKNDMEPIKKHVAYVEGALKALGVLAMMVTIVSGLLKIIHVI